MIELDKSIIEKIILDCDSQLSNAPELSFNSVEDVIEKIKIFDCGIVYFIYVDKDLKYVGKSRGKYFRQRMKAHFFGIGKGTNSKFDFIKNQKGQVTLKFLKTNPESLRNLIEECLIEKYYCNNQWNYKIFKSQIT